MTANLAELKALRARVDAEIRRHDQRNGTAARAAHRHTLRAEKHADDLAAAVLGVLRALDVTARTAARCCPTCGCLLAAGEPCPNTPAHPDQETS